MLIRKVGWKAANILFNRIFFKKRKTVIPHDTCSSPLSNPPAFPAHLLGPSPDTTTCNHFPFIPRCLVASPMSRAHKVLKGQGTVCHFNRFNTST